MQTINGIDVSHYQGQIDWQQVVKDPQQIKFVFIKTSGADRKNGGLYFDPMLHQNAIGAKNAGLKIGYYHFASLNTHDVAMDAQTEANFFLSAIKNLPPNDFPLALDLEQNILKLTPLQVQLWMNSFFTTIIRAGKLPALYSYAPFLDENLPADHGFGNVPLLLAAYVNHEPKLPHGWTDYTLHQFSDHGNVQGITERVDMDRIKIAA